MTTGMARDIPGPALTGSELLLEIGSVGRQLATSFGDLLRAIPGAPTAPKQLADTLRIDRALAFRLLAAVRRQDPLATTHVIPGPEPLERVVRAAGRKGVPADVLRSTSEAVANFRHLIKAHAGDRGALDAIISASLPDARARYESEAKQLMYRGARQIKGIAADVLVDVAFLHPSTDPARHDLVGVHGFFGLRRVRPNAHLRLATDTVVAPSLGGQDPPRTLDGEPLRDFRGVVLEPFCLGFPVELQIMRRGTDDIHYMLDWGQSVGCGSVRDIVLAEVHRKLYRRCRPADDPRKRAGLNAFMEVPTRTYIYDVLFHEDAFPGREPQLGVFQSGQHGYVNVNDPAQDVNRLEVLERVEFLGQGIDRFRIADVPNYIELLQYVCGKLGWDPQGFRCYRARIEYPIFGSQVVLSFEVPVETESRVPHRE